MAISIIPGRIVEIEEIIAIRAGGSGRTDITRNRIGHDRSGRIERGDRLRRGIGLQDDNGGRAGQNRLEELIGFLHGIVMGLKVGLLICNLFTFFAG